MSTQQPDARRPDADVQALDRLVGTWQLSGEAVGTISYRWMEGGFFLIQDGDLELFGHRNTFIEIIGRLRPFGGEPSCDTGTFNDNGTKLEGTWSWPGGGYSTTATRHQ